MGLGLGLGPGSGLESGLGLELGLGPGLGSGLGLGLSWEARHKVDVVARDGLEVDALRHGLAVKAVVVGKVHVDVAKGEDGHLGRVRVRVRVRVRFRSRGEGWGWLG